MNIFTDLSVDSISILWWLRYNVS